MKKLYTSIFLAAVCCFGTILQATPTFYIEKTENKSGKNVNLSVIQSLFVDAFSKAGKIITSPQGEKQNTYKIIPSVVDWTEKHTLFELTQRVKVESKLSIVISCIDLQSNEIILTKKITTEFSKTTHGTTARSLFSQCAEEAARKAAIAFSEEISPVKVLAINENKIITNAPEGLYHTGNCFNVVRKINNYEQEIAIIRITEIKSKQATCEVVTLKDKNAIKTGDICRLTASKSVK